MYLNNMFANLIMFDPDSDTAGGGSDGGEKTGLPYSGDENSSTDDNSEEVDEPKGKAKEAADSDNQEGEADGDGEDSDGEEEKGEEEATEYTADDFKFPEGSEIDEAMMGEFLSVVNNKELTGKDRDQAFVDLYVKKMEEGANAQLDKWEEVRKGWKEESKNNPVYGGKAYKKNQGVMLKALNEYGGAELKKLGDYFGFSDNPHYQEFLFNVGKTLSEDKTVNNGSGGGQSEPIEKRWYGSGDK